MKTKEACKKKTGYSSSLSECLFFFDDSIL